MNADSPIVQSMTEMGAALKQAGSHALEIRDAMERTRLDIVEPAMLHLSRIVLPDTVGNQALAAQLAEATAAIKAVAATTAKTAATANELRKAAEVLEVRNLPDLLG